MLALRKHFMTMLAKCLFAEPAAFFTKTLREHFVRMLGKCFFAKPAAFG